MTALETTPVRAFSNAHARHTLQIFAGHSPSDERIHFRRCNNGGNAMVTLMVFHEVDDVAHWLASPKREELFGPLGIKVRAFRDPQGSNRVGVLVETPDMDTWHAALQTDQALAAMKHDGVRPDTILELTEG